MILTKTFLQALHKSLYDRHDLNHKQKSGDDKLIDCPKDSNGVKSSGHRSIAGEVKRSTCMNEGCLTKAITELPELWEALGTESPKLQARGCLRSRLISGAWACIWATLVERLHSL